jgi:hypothetical protein
VPRCGSSQVYFPWRLLNFFNLWVYSFRKIQKISKCYYGLILSNTVLMLCLYTPFILFYCIFSICMIFITVFKLTGIFCFAEFNFLIITSHFLFKILHFFSLNFIWSFMFLSFFSLLSSYFCVPCRSQIAHTHFIYLL